MIGLASTLFSPFLLLLEGFSSALVGTFLNMTLDALFFLFSIVHCVFHCRRQFYKMGTLHCLQRQWFLVEVFDYIGDLF